MIDFDFIQFLDNADECNAAARNNSFFHGCTGRMQCIFNTGFLFFHFNFRRSADLQYRDTAGKLCKTFLQFFLVVVRSGFIDLLFDFIDALFDIFLLACTLNDGGVIFIDRNAFGSAEIRKRGIFQFVSFFFGYDLSACEDCDIFKHCLAAVAEAGSLYGRHAQCSAQFINHKRCKRFAFQLFRNDEKRFAGLCNFLENRKKIFHSADLLVVNEDVRSFQYRFHTFCIRDKIRGQITAVELHAFHDFQSGLSALGFFDRDDSVFSDFVHRIGNEIADSTVVVR